MKGRVPDYTVEIPYPPTALRPNARSRSHWPRTRALAEYRLWAKLAAMAVLGPRRPMLARADVAAGFLVGVILGASAVLWLAWVLAPAVK